MILNSSDCPCRGCADRHVGCHQNCSDYKDWYSALQNKKMNYLHSIKGDNEFRSYQKKQSLRYYKKYGHL